jgi:hypothetical protein
MNLELLNNFRIVRGTSLSLQMGHRVSVDIDLFTDMSYDSFNFNLLDEEIKNCSITLKKVMVETILWVKLTTLGMTRTTN